MKTNNLTYLKSQLLFLVVLVLVLGSVACNSASETQAIQPAEPELPTNGMVELTKQQFESAGMQLGLLTATDFKEVVRATGMFDVPPEYQATVSSYFGGTVKQLKLIPGEYVKKGQLLFVLENPDFVQVQQDYLEAKGQLTYLKSDYERQKNLSADNVTSQKNFLKAEAEYTVTRVKLEALAKRLSLMHIDPVTLSVENLQTSLNVRSPISGYVTEVNTSRGMFLNPSAPALSIINTEHLHLELNIFEKDIAKVKIGQTIQFSIQGAEGVQYPGSVHLINRTVDEESRTLRVHGHLDDEKLSKQFSPGMYVEAEIFTTSSAKASLPDDALVEVEGQYFTLILQDSTASGYTFQEREVKVGESSNGFVEVKNASDFAAGSRFLVKGGFNLIGE